MPLADAALITSRSKLANRKLLELNQMPTLLTGQNIANSLGELVAEQWAICSEANQRCLQDSNKTPSDYFGEQVRILQCLCQVGLPSKLLAVWYHSLARDGKKKGQQCLQQIVDEEAVDNMGYSSLRMTITPGIFSKDQPAHMAQ
jgi:hypothetical protein